MNAGAHVAGVGFRFRNGHLEPDAAAPAPDEPLLAADSWLVQESRVLALDLHRERFGLAALRHGVDAGDLDAFWEAVIARIPASGDWFPRVELRRSGLRLLMRHAPERTRAVVLATAPGPDRRTQPTVKGPDLEAMGALRADVAPRGAGEAVILSPAGEVVEGAYSALLWWRGDTLCAPSAELPRIPSITARTVLTLAAALGVETAEESVAPYELDGSEIWALSALHGIRIVTEWIDGPATAEEPGRLSAWRTRLGGLTRPITTLT